MQSQTTEPIGFTANLGRSYCHEHAPGGAEQFTAYTGKTAEFIDRCDICHTNIAEKPVIIEGLATIEYVLCKIF
jgi:hypothetical protein